MQTSAFIALFCLAVGAILYQVHQGPCTVGMEALYLGGVKLAGCGPMIVHDRIGRWR